LSELGKHSVNTNPQMHGVGSESSLGRSTNATSSIK